MRTIFALTVVLGIAGPALTTTTAKNVAFPVDDAAPEFRVATKKEPQQKQAPLAVSEIEGHVGSLASLDSNEAKAEKAKAEKAEAEKAEAEKAEAEKAEAEEVAKAEKSAVAAIAAVAAEEPTTNGTVPIEQVCEAVADAASAQGLPVGFFARLLWQESKFNQWARSHVGAMGVAQFMPTTAVEYGLENPFDPIESVAASARFLRELRDEFGNLGLAAAAYNAGGGRIRKWLSGQSGLPEETQNYVKVITGHPAKRWTMQKPLQASFALPNRAPCEGVEGLSRTAAAESHPVQLTSLATNLIEEAEAAERARIVAAQAARIKKYAAARVAKNKNYAAKTVKNTRYAAAKSVKGRKTVTKVAAKSRGKKVRVASSGR
ncbi:lytic transglycosylase domain-containing protein [Bradyrhizobium sp. LHD-71]|uniref:lytic transglycosylase domain-containing protein n=1 Tax=Bradyrhizobium sp. LHD-71 TaxID=3072141 RepID=UPI00280CF2EC|nr:lytic transglycosylase domain-containing protein [Bradyrhizobium sp. LHD-71]MDQ8730855.1 lytic transglycosylase domain-containing protein [Bradyrhizobium sp. LHD-71]